MAVIPGLNNSVLDDKKELAEKIEYYSNKKVLKILEV